MGIISSPDDWLSVDNRVHLLPPLERVKVYELYRELGHQYPFEYNHLILERALAQVILEKISSALSSAADEYEEAMKAADIIGAL